MVLLALAFTGCASVGSVPTPGVPTAERPYLRPPYEGWSGSLSPDASADLARLHGALVESDDRAAARLGAEALLAADASLDPARVLLAQVALVDGDPIGSLDRLSAVLDRDPQYLAAALTAGRAAERAGLPVDAFAAYWPVRYASTVATERLEALSGTVTQELDERFRRQLEEGRVESAGETLADLRAWSPDAPATAAAVGAFAAATASPEERLARLRVVPGSSGADRELTRQRAELEIEVGDAAVAARLAEGLLAEKPHDLYARHLLDRARFQWRFNLLPSEVRSLARRSALERDEFALLLYWLFPQVRYGRPAEARIATDVIDHPQREAIVRVINLGLLDVDPTVHRFEPDQPVERADAFGALLRLVATVPGKADCLAAGQAPQSDELVCDAAAACGLIGEVAECLPTATVSGADAMEAGRRILLRIGDE